MNYYNEHSKKNSAWLRELVCSGLISDGFVDDRDIQDVRPEDLSGYDQIHLFAGIGGWDEALRIAGWPKGRKVWTASFPCQPFSVGGQMAGFDDSRHLWPVGFFLIKECSPPIIFGEQVENAVQMGWLDRVFDDLEGIGYSCAASVLRADGVGAPHRRRRLYWVASHADIQGGEGLVENGGSCQIGQWNWRGQEDLQSLAREPFLQTDRWPQPLVRSVDDGVQGRVDGCFAAGNAIVPQIAAIFVQAATEAIQLQLQ
jgi:DNA (cytosine-5)-methyltransferase 1